MSDAKPNQEESSSVVISAGTHGGFRPGAGRKVGGVTKAQAWERFEKRIFAAAGRELSPEQLKKMCMADPWRFVERIVIPLIGHKHRQTARIGVSVDDGVRSTQFVLDLGELNEEQAANDDGALIAEAIEDLTKHIGG